MFKRTITVATLLSIVYFFIIIFSNTSRIRQVGVQSFIATPTLVPAYTFEFPLGAESVNGEEYGPYAHNGYGVQNPFLSDTESCFVNINGIRVHMPQLYHAGTDWFSYSENAAGDDVTAIGNGRVVFVKSNFYPGDVIIIEHRLPNGNPYFSQYGHVVGRTVYSDEVVTLGEKLGEVYDWGDNSHLHWEIRNFDHEDNLNLYPLNSAGGRGIYYPPDYRNCNQDYGVGYNWDDNSNQQPPDYWGYTNPDRFVLLHRPQIFLPTIFNNCCDPAYEPNDSFDDAYQINTETYYDAYIWSQNDQDWFKFYVSASPSAPKYINAYLRNIPLGTNYNLELYSPSGQYLTGSFNSGNADEYLSKRVTEIGWYRVKVYSVAGFHQSDSYRLKISLVHR